MISLSPSHLRRRSLRLTFALVLFIQCGLLPLTAAAQSGQQLSISPALFEIAVVPGQSWQSTIKVVNANPQPLTIYVEPVNFAPRGEGGDGTLLPVPETEQDGTTVAEWITLDSQSYEIGPESSAGVSFTLNVPNDAAPGGHFAAFMVGTRPPGDDGRTELRTAQILTSLFFVRVAGDVVEKGTIREFRPQKWFRSQPEATLELRFENTGNVHLRPQGDIVISNMWGQERGIIPINRQGHFGNVLPESIRKFTFTWRGEQSLSDMGRYRAEVTLAYGSDARQFVTSVTYFWVVPVIPVLSAIAVLVITISLLVWLVRLYVRKLIERAGFGPRYQRPYVREAARRGALIIEVPSSEPSSVPATKPTHSWRERMELAREMLVLFRERVAPYLPEGKRAVMFALAALVLLIIGIGIFVRSAVTPQRSYEIKYEDSAGGVVSSDEIMYEKERKLLLNDLPEGVPVVNIVNESGVAGAAATIALMLETQQYYIGDITTSMGEERGKSVVVIYDEAQTEFGLKLSDDLGGALLSTFGSTTSSTSDRNPFVTVYLGADVSGETPAE